MEIKYLFTIGLIIIIAMGSIAIAKNKDSQSPVDPITSFYDIE